MPTWAIYYHYHTTFKGQIRYRWFFRLFKKHFTVVRRDAEFKYYKLDPTPFEITDDVYKRFILGEAAWGKGKHQKRAKHTKRNVQSTEERSENIPDLKKE